MEHESAGAPLEQRGEHGGIVLGWLLRVTIFLLVLGVLVFDVFSLAYTNVTTVDDASIVASFGAATLIENPRDAKAARAESLRQAESLGVAMSTRDWWVDEAGDEIIPRGFKCLYYICRKRARCLSAKGT
jgi:hypothetical protein